MARGYGLRAYKEQTTGSFRINYSGQCSAFSDQSVEKKKEFSS